MTHPMTIGKVVSNYCPKRKKGYPKSIHLVGTGTIEVSSIWDWLNTGPYWGPYWTLLGIIGALMGLIGPYWYPKSIFLVGAGTIAVGSNS